MPQAAGARLRAARRFVLTFALSAAGGFVFDRLGMPAGWISGGLLAVAVASLAGFNSDVPRPVRPAVFIVLGLYAGGGVTQQTLHQMQTWPLSFAILAVALVAMIGSAYWVLHVRFGWDRNAALLASLPGALTFVMAAAEGLKVDLKAVAIAQSVRLFVIVEGIPLVALLVGHPPGPAAANTTAIAGPTDIAILVVVGTVAAFVLERLHVIGGWMLGGMLASSGLLLSGLIDARLPFQLVLPFVITLAAITGSRFRPGDLAILPRLLKPSLIAFGFALAISFIAAGAVTLLLGVNFIQTLIAFAPGALDALVILAFQMHVDPAYVAAHHVARFLAMVIAVPILARWISRP